MYLRSGNVFKRLVFMLCLFVGSASVSWASDEASKLVINAESVITSILKDPKQDGLRNLLKTCHAVMIIPAYVKAGLVFGGAGGSGVLLAHDNKANTWSAPAFYGLGAASVGLQIGVSSSEVVMVVMNERGLRALMKNKVKLGADLSVAAGPVGQRGETATTANLVADIYSYARSRGLFAGVSFEGALIQPRETYHAEYYGKQVSPTDILLKQNTGKNRAVSLRAALARASQSD